MDLRRPGILLALVTSLATAGSALAAIVRPPTPTERAALQQATFDYYFTNSALANSVVSSVKVEVLAGPQPLRSRLVTKYAVIGIHAFDTTGQDVGYALAIAAYYSSPARGWRVFNDGTSDVGCSAKWYPVGQERAILKALGLKCTS
jgi:hypothetical protein